MKSFRQDWRSCLSTKSFWNPFDSPKISGTQQLSTYNEDSTEVELTSFTHHHLLSFYSIVSGRKNWMPDKSPKDYKRCWRNSARWSGNSPAATKLKQGGEEETWIEQFTLLFRSKSPSRIIELTFRLLFSSFLFHGSSRQ